MDAVVHETREGWLLAAIAAVTPLFVEAKAEVPKVRVSTGFMSGGGPNRIGECHYGAGTADGVPQIFIHPKLEQADVVGVLVHELVHACLDHEAGHGPRFRKLAEAIGLEGRMTATEPSDLLSDRLVELVEPLGAYPHAIITGERPADAPKPQKNRQLKMECPGCGMIARTSQKWIDEVGPPVCTMDGQQFEVEVREEEGE